MGKKLLLIVNPRAGKMKLKSALFDIVDIFHKNGYEAIIYPTYACGDAVKIINENADKFDHIVVCGGDGTLKEGVTGIMGLKKKVTLGYIPCGTTNDFASSLKLPKNIKLAANKASTGHPTSIDIGLFNGEYFAYIASFGAFTKSSYSVPQNAKNSFGHLAYVMEAMKDIGNIRPYHMKIKTDTQEVEGDYIFGAISNSTTIGGLVKLSEKIVDFSDGLFEIMLIKMPQNAIEFQKIISSLLYQDYKCENITFMSMKKAVIETDEILAWSLDGEYCEGKYENIIENIPKSVEVLL